VLSGIREERWGAGVETQKNVRGEIGGWGRVPFNETYAPSLSTIYDGAQGSLNFLKMVLDPSPPPLSERHKETQHTYRDTEDTEQTQRHEMTRYRHREKKRHHTGKQSSVLREIHRDTSERYTETRYRL